MGSGPNSPVGPGQLLFSPLQDEGLDGTVALLLGSGHLGSFGHGNSSNWFLIKTHRASFGHRQMKTQKKQLWAEGNSDGELLRGHREHNQPLPLWTDGAVLHRLGRFSTDSNWDQAHGGWENRVVTWMLGMPPALTLLLVQPRRATKI